MGVVRSINTRSTVVVVILRTSPADTTLLLLALPLVYPLPPPPCRLCQWLWVVCVWTGLADVRLRHRSIQEDRHVASHGRSTTRLYRSRLCQRRRPSITSSKISSRSVASSSSPPHTPVCFHAELAATEEEEMRLRHVVYYARVHIWFRIKNIDHIHV